MSGNGYTTGNAVALQPMVVALAASRAESGITVAELREIATEHHHGTLSGTLSNAHRDGSLSLLDARRGRCRIYVYPEFVNGRETRPHGRNHLEVINA